MKYKVRMIAVDLDGTLLRTDKTVSERSKTVLRQCREAGIKVVYATGRGGSAEHVAPASFFDGRVTMNGATAKVGDKIVYERLMPWRTASPILIACDKHGLKIASEVSTMHYANFVVSDLWPEITNFEIVDFSQHEMEIEKIYTPNPSPADVTFIKQLLPEDLYFVLTVDVNGHVGQIMHKDATKAKAVSELALLWGITQSEIVAFGDDLNDIDLLATAGIGVAVENAHHDVKSIANAICGSNDEDGIAEWLLAHIDM
jgi:hypothetical protein